MSRHRLPRNCLKDSLEFQNLFWLCPCSYCIHSLFESRTKLYLMSNWKALILIHRRQTSNVSQTSHKTTINQRLCGYVRKINIIFSKDIFGGRARLFAENNIYPIDDLIFIIHLVLTSGIRRKHSSLPCLYIMFPLRSQALPELGWEAFRTWSIWELGIPGSPQTSFEVGWLWCLSRWNLWMKFFTSWQY